MIRKEKLSILDSECLMNLDGFMFSAANNLLYKTHCSLHKSLLLQVNVHFM